MAPHEVDAWKEWAGKFDLAHIHACWQMTLEGQRRVLTSLEPAMALELLLFNLACLPQLINLDDPAHYRLQQHSLLRTVLLLCACR